MESVLPAGERHARAGDGATVAAELTEGGSEVRQPGRVGTRLGCFAALSYGVVVESAKVRVLLYVPARSTSVAPMA